jgi:hypothetical protein
MLGEVMTDESAADQKVAELRDLALPWEQGYQLAVECAFDTVKGMRTAFNKFAGADPYEAGGKSEPWDFSAFGKSDPAVCAMAETFTQILNRRGLLKIDLVKPLPKAGERRRRSSRNPP